jgi:glycosyltransferase involved in cell wall biosynthesis
MGAPQVSIVIPIYREAAILDRAITSMTSGLDRRGISYEIILVEQSSDQATLDTSLEVAGRFPRVRHLLLPIAAFGQAMRVGMLEAVGMVIVNFDIDYWDLTFVRMCLATMLEFDIDVVIGSKNARLSVDNRALSRRLISQVFRIVLQIVFGLRVSDTHGIKAWHSSPRLIEQIKACRFTRDIFDTELVIRGERAGFRLLELPVTVAEQRPPRSSIFARAPGAALNLLKLYLVLSREVSRRSTPTGMIVDRQRVQAAISEAAMAAEPPQPYEPARPIDG